MRNVDFGFLMWGFAFVLAELKRGTLLNSPVVGTLLGSGFFGVAVLIPVAILLGGFTLQIGPVLARFLFRAQI